MSGFFIGLGTFILMLTGIFLILIILMQRPSENAGLGSTLGGGIAESAFGGGASQVLTRWTIYGVITFFILSFVLALSSIGRKPTIAIEKGLPAIETPVKGSLTTVPAATKRSIAPAATAEQKVVPVQPPKSAAIATPAVPQQAKAIIPVQQKAVEHKGPAVNAQGVKPSAVPAPIKPKS